MLEIEMLKEDWMDLLFHFPQTNKIQMVSWEFPQIFRWVSGHIPSSLQTSSASSEEGLGAEAVLVPSARQKETLSQSLSCGVGAALPASPPTPPEGRGSPFHALRHWMVFGGARVCDPPLWLLGQEPLGKTEPSELQTTFRWGRLDG